MDNKEILVNVIKENLNFLTSYGKTYLYPNIPTKLNSKFTKYFDTNINLDDVVAFVDNTLMASGKGGLLFALNGFYYLDTFKKPKYFNYINLDMMIVIPDKSNDPLNATLEIGSNENEALTIGYGSYNKDILKLMLEDLKIAAVEWIDSNYNEKPNGKVEKLDLTKDQLTKCNYIIHSASVAAGGVGTGLAQIPLADNALIVPIQITMITSIGAVFKIRVTEGTAKSILATLLTSFIGRGISQVVLGWVPGLGNAINTATAAGVTEAAGWLAVKHFWDIQNKEKVRYKQEWMKEGYVKASHEYEIKFRKQAEDYVQQGKIYGEEKQEFYDLLDNYDQLIVEYQNKLNRSEEENRQLKEMLNMRENLNKLQIAI